MNKILENGLSWPISELADDTRASDLEEALTFGNHKRAEEKPDLLREFAEKDITHGYGLVLPLEKVRHIPGLLMSPMNIQKQNTIDETGRIVHKDRLTHDQSYEWGSGTPVNSRLDKSELLPCMFGNMSKRILNWIVAARRKYPGVPIKCCKLDFKSAYQQEHMNWETAVQTCTQLPEDDLAIIALHLTFGGAPGPYEWGVMSETICDLANAIILDNNWNPKSLHCPN